MSKRQRSVEPLKSVLAEHSRKKAPEPGGAPEVLASVHRDVRGLDEARAGGCARLAEPSNHIPDDMLELQELRHRA
jgi:hypothetical protein